MRKFRHHKIRSLKRAALTKFRTKKAGAHRVVLAFPPGRRRRGSGRVSSVLHPRKKNIPVSPAAFKSWASNLEKLVAGTKRQLGAVRGVEDVFFNRMTQGDRDAFDQYLVSIKHPLAYEPGTQEDRFKNYFITTQEFREFIRGGGRGKKNPPVRIYETVKEIVAVKGPGHPCDAACKRARHTYVHRFTSRPSIYGMPDGSLVIR